MVANKRLTVAGFFAGVGGIEKGFEEAGFNPIWANELDTNACKTFRKNHPKTTLIERDIYDITPADVPDVDVIVGGFPCQAFSVAGYRKGFQDPRGQVFFKLASIIEERRPQAVLLENVKNLQNHDNGNTFKVIRQTLVELGYSVDARVMNASEYGGIPQNRERIYIVAFRDSVARSGFEWPEKIALKKSVQDFLEHDAVVASRFYYGENFPHFATLKKEMKNSDTVYQWRRQYLRENKSRQFPTLTANMGTGGHNVPLVLTSKGIRKLTPQECFNVQGFKDIHLPEGMALSHLYKQAGNSVVVPVIKRIAVQMKKALGQAPSEQPFDYEDGCGSKQSDLVPA